MFGLFKRKNFSDPSLGDFTRSKGKWRGNITLQNAGAVPLLLEGGGEAPDAEALEVARKLSAQFAAQKAEIRKSLFAHYEPYAENGECPVKVANDETLWKQVRILGVTVEKLGGVMTGEIAIAVEWDEEHTLGARLQAGKLVELNGSILCGF